jgi:hypothetical protein
MAQFTAQDYEVVTKLDGSESVKRSDGVTIPPDPRNRDYQEFLVIEDSDVEGVITRTAEKAQKSDVELLAERITTLEFDIDTVKTDVSTLESEVTSVKTDITDLKTEKEIASK